MNKPLQKIFSNRAFGYFMEQNRVCFLIHTCLLLLLSDIAFSQTTDSTKTISHFSGTISATHNGISLVPSFSLGKPAVLFNFSIGGKRLTFEPDIRFALEGKPWSFLFWWRYKAIQKDRFSLRVGVHPALNFRTIPVVSNGNNKDVIESRRFLAGEIYPSYAITDNIRIGTYYLYSRGLDDSQKNTHFLVLNLAFPNINLSDEISLSAYPGVYYLKADALDGFYFTSTVRLTKRNFPLLLESIINQKIRTEILPERSFVWNISLVYPFNKQFVGFQPEI